MKKRVLCILLAVLTILSLCSCGSTKNSENVTEPETEKQSGLEFSKDLIIQDVYLQKDGTNASNIYYTLKNNSQDTVIDYTINFLAFDRNGNLTRINGSFGDIHYAKKSVSLANILPGSIYGLNEQADEAHHYLGSDNAIRYVEAAISHIKYKSGEEWNLEDESQWEEYVVSNFDMESHNNHVSQLKDAAIKAMSNPYIKINSSELLLNSNPILAKMESYGYTLECEFEFIGDKSISNFSIIVLEYDADGNPITLGTAGYASSIKYITNNSKSFSLNTAGSATDDVFYGSWDAAIDKSCDQVVTILQSIEFEDGTDWRNENALQFMMYGETVKPE